MKKIIINSTKYGKFIVKVDDNDFIKVNKFNWHIRKSRLKFYAQCNQYYKGMHSIVQMHILITGYPPGQTDHIDGDSLNNQRSNLRRCLHNQNCKNQKLKINNKSGYKGVWYEQRTGQFTCQVISNYKKIWGGRFNTAKAAARRYNELATKHHGKFARLNVIK